MASLGWTPITGAGEAAIIDPATYLYIQGVEVWVTGFTGSKERFIGAVEPRGMAHAGAVALIDMDSTDDVLTGKSVVSWYKYIRWEREYDYIYPQVRYASGYLWRLQAGLTAEINIYW